jgi:hypothetical protein
MISGKKKNFYTRDLDQFLRAAHGERREERSKEEVKRK